MAISDSDFHRLCDEFVHKHVRCRISCLIDSIAKSEETQEALGIDQDELINVMGVRYFQLPYQSTLVWEQDGAFCCLLLQERYTPDNWEELKDDFSSGSLEPAASVKLDVLQAANPDVVADDIGWHEAVAYFRHTGAIPAGVKDKVICDCPDDVDVDEDCIDEALEHWIISADLAYWFNHWLDEPEAVSDSVFDDGFWVWGRSTSGQSIALDGCIRQVVRKLHDITDIVD